jgi:hypothetical protein
MITNFPDPYPGELFYSIAARHHERKAYSSASAAAQELLGMQNPRATIDFPRNLQYLEENLQPGSSYTADYLIDYHTQFPYHAPFKGEKRRKVIREGMKNTWKNLTDRNAKAGEGLTHLRYCPNCAKLDRQLYGETYWHTLHQIPEVKLCPDCKVWLIESTVTKVELGLRQFIPADEVISSDDSSVIVDMNLKENQIYAYIAQEAKWLLEHPNIEMDAPILKERYSILLLNRGLASYSGELHTREISDDFQRHIPEKILKEFSCELTNGLYNNWYITRILRDEYRNYPPIRHLLFAYFLGISMQELLTKSLERKPFGNAAFPCLNFICDHYKEPVIFNTKIVAIHLSRVEGQFHCPACGFIYQRIGPDFHPELWKRATKIISHGHIFESRLRELLTIKGISLKKMAKLLRCAEETVKKELDRLSLPLPENSAAKPVSYRPRKSYQVDPERLEEYKQKWQKTYEENPNLSRKQLRELCKHEYYYIKMHDPDWLEEHNPPKKHPFEKQDWAVIDADLVIKIDKVYEQLLLQLGKPIWINSASLSRAMGLRDTYLTQHRHELLETTKLLDKYAESNEQWAIRRLRWAGEEFIAENKIPSLHQLLVFAGAKRKVIEPEVMIEAKKVLERIQKNVQR